MELTAYNSLAALHIRRIAHDLTRGQVALIMAGLVVLVGALSVFFFICRGDRGLDRFKDFFRLKPLLVSDLFQRSRKFFKIYHRFL